MDVSMKKETGRSRMCTRVLKSGRGKRCDARLPQTILQIVWSIVSNHVLPTLRNIITRITSFSSSSSSTSGTEGGDVLGWDLIDLTSGRRTNPTFCLHPAICIRSLKLYFPFHLQSLVGKTDGADSVVGLEEWNLTHHISNNRINDDF